ncbi:MetQ/NlpA family ABC transporter substrate-binding protein [Endozoicomonas sp. Mp262]|uniref:MetQ/NlpA family ABC transporter substrate-binding protein n=1 Tax=Endozoicomonas sp. Mp262 TaxID=2919499 RepID=UPI0021D8B794
MDYLTSVKTLKALAGSLLVATVVLMAGCGDRKAEDNVLKVGVIAGPEADVMQVAADTLKNEKGIDVKLVEFSDYVSPNIALSDGSIDVNAFQHRPYLDSMVQDRGFKLVAVGNTFIYPIGGYSKKITHIDQLKEGAKVAIPNDPSNEGRTLILLHNRGLITLKDINNLEATPADIVENPKGLKFIELDAAQLPRSLDDVDLAFINSTYSVPAGLLPSRDALIIEGKESPYVNIIVSREDNQADPKVTALVKAYQTEAVEKLAAELFKGSAMAGWK